jgi:putative CRISPR-associated protein (TIGR02620 family)
MNIIITRHRPLVDWLAARNIVGTVIEQATADDVRGKHVYGVLPLWLAAEAESVTEVSMPGITLEQRRRNASGDMSVEEMDAAGAHLVTYKVTRI